MTGYRIAIAATLLVVGALFTSNCEADEAKYAELFKQSDNEEVAKLGKSYLTLLQEREWTSSAGTKLRASFAGLDGSKAVLRDSGGKEFPLELSQLSPSDQTLIIRALAIRLKIAGLREQQFQQFQEIKDQLKRSLATISLQAKDNKMLEDQKTAADMKLAALGGGGALPDDDGVPIVFLNQIKITGKKYVGKTVRMKAATFFSADPPLAYAPSRPKDNWIAVSITDARKSAGKVWADKKALGEVVVEFPVRSKIDIEGTVIATPKDDLRPEMYFFIISKIVRVK